MVKKNFFDHKFSNSHNTNLVFFTQNTWKSLSTNDLIQQVPCTTQKFRISHNTNLVYFTSLVFSWRKEAWKFSRTKMLFRQTFFRTQTFGPFHNTTIVFSWRQEAWKYDNKKFVWKNVFWKKKNLIFSTTQIIYISQRVWSFTGEAWKKKFNKILFRTKQKTNLAFSTTEIMPNYSNKFALLLKTTSLENLENKNIDYKNLFQNMKCLLLLHDRKLIHFTTSLVFF